LFTSNIPFVTFIDNPKKQEGFIEKVFIKLYQDKALPTTQTISSLTQKRQVFTIQPPEYLKIRILLFSAKDTIPYQNLSKEPIIVEIRKFESQWIDVSAFHIPFPENGIFVGMQVVTEKTAGAMLQFLCFFQKKCLMIIPFCKVSGKEKISHRLW
jgi:hypothetical protein